MAIVNHKDIETLELLLIRHPQTNGDIVYVEEGDFLVPYHGVGFLKGQAEDKERFRMSHLGVLQAVKTIEEVWKHIDRHGGGSIDMTYSFLTRCFEYEEFAKTLLGDIAKRTHSNTSEGAIERSFPAQGHPVSEITRHFKDSIAAGDIPFPLDLSINNFLLYSDPEHWRRIESRLGIEHTETESFNQTLVRGTETIKEIIDRALDRKAKYAFVFTHKIMAPFLYAGMNILESREGNVPETNDLLQRRQIVRPFYLDPSRFIRMRVARYVENGNIKYAIRSVLEVNDGKHLSGELIIPREARYLFKNEDDSEKKSLGQFPSAHSKLSSGHALLANYRRGQISGFYVSKRMDVELDPAANSFEATDSDHSHSFPIYHPENLSWIFKADDAIVTHHTIVDPNSIPRWLRESIGEFELASLVEKQLRQYRTTEGEPPVDLQGVRKDMLNLLDVYFEGTKRKDI
jgi:hypothetical protein